MAPLGPLVGAHRETTSTFQLLPWFRDQKCCQAGCRMTFPEQILNSRKSLQEIWNDVFRLSKDSRCFCTNQTWGGMTRGPQKHCKSKHRENFRRYYWKGLYSFEPQIFVGGCHFWLLDLVDILKFYYPKNPQGPSYRGVWTYLAGVCLGFSKSPFLRGQDYSQGKQVQNILDHSFVGPAYFDNMVRITNDYPFNHVSWEHEKQSARWVYPKNTLGGRNPANHLRCIKPRK